MIKMINQNPIFLGANDKDNALKEAISALENKEFDKAIQIIDFNRNTYSSEFHDARSMIGQIKTLMGMVQGHQAYLSKAEHEIKRAESKWFPGSKEEHLILAKNYLKEAQKMAASCNAHIKRIMISFDKLKVDAKKVIEWKSIRRR